MKRLNPPTPSSRFISSFDTPNLARECKEVDMDVFDKFSIDTNFAKPFDEPLDEMVPDGLDPEVWKFMTESEKAAFR